MKMIGILFFISWFTLNHASTSCSDTGFSSSCYGAIINDDYVYCNGHTTCGFSVITASVEVRCAGYVACAVAEIESTGSVLCYSMIVKITM